MSEPECDDCILVAEDDANIRRLIALSLRREGYSPVEASNGRDALDLMRKGEAEVVVLDLMMPASRVGTYSPSVRAIRSCRRSPSSS